MKPPKLPFEKPIEPNPKAKIAKGPIDLKKVRDELKRAQVKSTFWGK